MHGKMRASGKIFYRICDSGMIVYMLVYVL